MDDQATIHQGQEGAELQDPTSKHPKPPFNRQKQPWPWWIVA